MTGRKVDPYVAAAEIRGSGELKKGGFVWTADRVSLFSTVSEGQKNIK